MLKPSVANAQIKKINTEGTSVADDLLAVEEPLEIRLGYGPAKERIQKSIAVTMRTPGHDFELALGFLFTEGIIKKYSDVTSIKYCTELNRTQDNNNSVRVELKEDITPDLKNAERNFYTTSSCGICGKASIEAIRTHCEPTDVGHSLQVHAQLICLLPDILRNHQSVFRHTGGLHASALFDCDANLLLLREDVGRHNALDKLIGASVAAGTLPLSHSILLLSGRTSFELVQKAAMAGIKIIAAVGAPSSLAVQTAKEFNITLIGFLRNERFNIYSGEERIVINMTTPKV